MKVPRTGKHYKFYRRFIRKRIIELQDNIDKLMKRNIILLEFIEPYAPYFVDGYFTFKDLEDIIESKYENKASKLIYASSRRYNLINAELSYAERIEVISNLGMIITNAFKLIRYRNSIIKLKKYFKTTYELFSYILMTYNYEMSKYLIKGYHLNIGASVGKLKVHLSEVKNYSEKAQKNRINWNDTFKNLLSLSATYSNTTKQFLLDYDEAYLTKLEFIRAAGRELTREGVDWYVASTEDSYPLLRWRKSQYVTRNARYFRFRPSSYNYTPYLYEEYLKNANDVDEIIGDERLGVRDKLSQIHRLDTSYFYDVKYLQQTRD